MTSRRLPRIIIAATAFLGLLMLFVSCSRGAEGSKEVEGSDRIERTIQQSGINRDYIVHLPPDPGSRTSWPVLMAFHPAFATASDFERITKFHEAPGAENFVVVYPNGLRRSWNVGPCCGAAKERGMDDTGFFSAIMADLNTMVPVEPRAYVTGFSNGAMLVYDLVCKNSGSIAAAAPSGGTITLSNTTCNPNQPVPILHLHGEEDQFAPLAGGQSKFKRVGVQPPILSGLTYLAKENGCSGKTSQTRQQSDLTCTDWLGCPANDDVTLCLVPDLGHLWAGSDETAFSKLMGLGPSDTNVSATNMIVQFFLEHRK